MTAPEVGACPPAQLVLFGCDLQGGDYSTAAVEVETGVCHITGCTITGAGTAIDVMTNAECHVHNCDISFNEVLSTSVTALALQPVIAHNLID